MKNVGKHCLKEKTMKHIKKIAPKKTLVQGGQNNGGGGNSCTPTKDCLPIQGG